MPPNSKTPVAGGNRGLKNRRNGKLDRKDDIKPTNPVQENSDKKSAGRSNHLSVEQFYAYMPMHRYLFEPSRDLWPSSSVNARVKPIPIPGKPGKSICASDWLDKHHAIDQMTWAPGEEMLIRNRLISNGGWIVKPGCVSFNLYRPPIAATGNPREAARWVSHVKMLYGEDAMHIIKYLAHRVQKPGEKINHALVLGGAQGIGKDTTFEPVKHAVGAWNFTEVTPAQLLGRFNGFVKSVILRVSEARDLGDVDRYGFYEHLKIYTAAPPDVLRVDEKNISEYAVLNVCGVILTTNHKTDGIYLPADDRRHFVAWSEKTKEEFDNDYFSNLYKWFAEGGNAHVAAYLAEYDLADFDPKAPPPKTPAFWNIVDANRAPEDAELADTIEAIGRPNAFTLGNLISRARSESLRAFLNDRRYRRQIPRLLETAGYVPVRNPAAADGLWKLGGQRQVIYARRDLPVSDRLSEASGLARGK